MLSEEEVTAPEEAYLSVVRRRAYYGAQFFNHVEPIGVKEFPSTVKLAVRYDGLMVLDDRMSLQAFFEFTTMKVQVSKLFFANQNG